MMKSVLSAFLFLSFSFLNGQTSDLSGDELNLPTELSVGIGLLNLVDPWTPTFQPELEYRFTDRFSGVAKYGIGLWNWQSEDLDFNSTQKLKLEIRMYLKGAIDSGNGLIEPRYFSLEYVNHNIDYRRFNASYSDDASTIAQSYEYVDFDRKVQGFRAKYGWQIDMGTRSFLDISFGLGARQVNSTARRLGPDVPSNGTEDGFFGCAVLCDEVNTSDWNPDLAIDLSLRFKIQ